MRLNISLVFSNTKILKTMVLAFKFTKKNYFQCRIYVKIIILKGKGREFADL